MIITWSTMAKLLLLSLFLFLRSVTLIALAPELAPNTSLLLISHQNVMLAERYSRSSGAVVMTEHN